MKRIKVRAKASLCRSSCIRGECSNHRLSARGITVELTGAAITFNLRINQVLKHPDASGLGSKRFVGLRPRDER
jgi:hypothetical protein